MRFHDADHQARDVVEDLGLGRIVLVQRGRLDAEIGRQHPHGQCPQPALVDDLQRGVADAVATENAWSGHSDIPSLPMRTMLA
jgi:hypothetical protein